MTEKKLMGVCWACGEEMEMSITCMCEKNVAGRKATAYQLSEWVAGRPHHNTVRDECCPDFSCCDPDALTSQDKREAFANASEEERMGMLMGFLGSAVHEEFGDKVDVAGMVSPDETIQ